MPYLERQHSQFVGDALLHRQPMQFLQQRVCAWRLMNDSDGGIVLHPLQLVDGAGWIAVEHSIAVVDPGKDQTSCKHLCEVHSQ